MRERIISFKLITCNIIAPMND